MSGTLKRDLERQLPRLYGRARRDLTRKLERHGEADALERLPQDCPYTFEQLLGDWWPSEPDGG